MKWLITPVLWGLALVIALGVLWRLWRGKPVILHGRWTPRVLRMVAVVLVLLGIGADRTEAAPIPLGEKKGKVEEELPPTITPEVVEKWVQLQARTSEWTVFKQRYSHALQAGHKPEQAEVQRMLQLAALTPKSLQELLTRDVEAVGRGWPMKKAEARELLAALDEAEKKGYVDPWLIAYVWRKSADVAEGAERKAVIDLMARLHRHARLGNALIACRVPVRDIMEPPVAWRSKAARPKEFNQNILQLQNQARMREMVNRLKSAYARADAGTWTKEAQTLLTVEKGSPPVTLIHGGQPGMPQSEGNFRLGRLDLLETMPGDKPVVLNHRTLGRIEIPAGRLVSVWDLPRFLPEKAKETLKKHITDALAGKEDAARQIEMTLPLAHALVREELKASPNAQGAAKLRLILTQFDDLPQIAPLASTEQRQVPDFGFPPQGRR